MSYYARTLADLLINPGLLNGREGPELVNGSVHMAHLLFMVVREHHGDRTARRIFAKQAKSLTPAQLKRIEEYRLLDTLDSMTPKPNVQRLARNRAEANKQLPRSQQRGAGSTDVFNLARKIRRAVKKRKAAMKKGAWWGPIPPEKR